MVQIMFPRIKSMPYPRVDQVTAREGVIDISSIPSTETEMCLEIDFSTDDTNVSPELYGWRITYVRYKSLD